MTIFIKLTPAGPTSGDLFNAPFFVNPKAILYMQRCDGDTSIMLRNGQVLRVKETPQEVGSKA